MLCVKDAKYSGGYSIQLTFNNGKQGIANLERTIMDDSRSIFAKLKDESNFRKFKVDHNTVIWTDELDLAPEYLFYLAFKEDRNLQNQFRMWGYIT